ncbi:hypothetical protein TRFO_01731 [Tritrichomonas foetus]|uniref:Uncharacterized protein n=1 Tax=Tritrichomonas foetus TaxID=1144522 RepID=A0A1J4JV46_9EUKA|nr:hypothetical protein TRFO_01731 [Tritrichomonas foetus]|eukprot:OHT01133.1 hypothetical protein TRFO_01731 [Tritrichomonas foetus]
MEEPEFPNTDENDENGDAKNGDAKNGDAKNGDAKNGDTKNDDTKNDDAKNDIDESGDTVFITKQTNSNIDQGKNEAVLDEADESFINGGNEIEGNDKSDDSKDDID